MSAPPRKQKTRAVPAPPPPTRTGAGAVEPEAEIVRELHPVEWEKFAVAKQKLARAESTYLEALRGLQDLVEIYTLKDPGLGVDPKRRAVVRKAPEVKG